MFSKYGRVKDIRVIKDALTQNSKGFAYILYESVEEADRAIDNLDN